MGYAGGTKDNPTYHSLGDHIETLELDYEPKVITYQELLDLFWTSHSPTSPAWSRQYMSAVFFHSEQQKQLALARKEQEEKRGRTEIFTELIPYSRFYFAEDYHQKYILQRSSALTATLKEFYPSMQDFVNATATARINGYLGQHGNEKTLRKELNSFGFPLDLKEEVLKYLNLSPLPSL